MSVAKQDQALLWSMITHNRRVTGESLSFLRMVDDDAYLASALLKARQTGDAELVAICDQLEASRKQYQSEASDGLAVAQGEGSHAATLPNQAQGDPRELHGYRELLLMALGEGEITYARRVELDHFIRRTRIHWEEALELEVALRQDMGLRPVDWSRELRLSIDAYNALPQGLTERDRLRMFDTYIKRGRLSMTHAEQILSLAAAQAPAQVVAEPKRRHHLGMTLGTAALITLSLIIGLPWLSPSQFHDAVREVTADADTTPKVVHVKDSIMEDTVWHAENTYYLDNIVFVEGSAKLAIEPGTTVYGSNGSALIITRDATLYARGTKTAPIVFTSAKPVGSRDRGDWGGVVLLGNAPINRTTGQIEGIDRLDVRGSFGGSDRYSNCGTLEYVRIEFAGFEVFADNELNGLTFGGCGSTTIVRNVQVHRSLDDGIEIFGGEVSLTRVVISGAKDDSLDWDMGWRGRVQFLIVQQHEDVGDNGIEADNDKKEPDVDPRSAPTIYNATLIGAPKSELGQRAMTLRRGTGGIFRNLIIAGFPLESVDVRGVESARLTQSGELSFSHTLMENIGPGGNHFFQEEKGEGDDDQGFDEARYFADPARNNYLGLTAHLTNRAYDIVHPLFTPTSRPDGVRTAPIPQEEFWDQGADFLGAIRPGVASSWVDGWTAFPLN